MTMTETTLAKLYFSIEQLQAVENFSSNDETRVHLNGVFLDPVGLMVATDGHTLGAVKAPHVAQSDNKNGYILPNEALANAFRVKPELKKTPYLFMFDPNNNTVNAIYGTLGDTESYSEAWASIECKPINATFPEWRRVVPKRQKLNTMISFAAFNGDYVSLFVNGIKGSSSDVNIFATGDGAGCPFIVLNSNPDFFGVLMPMRSSMEYESAFKRAESILALGAPPQAKAKALPAIAAPKAAKAKSKAKAS